MTQRRSLRLIAAFFAAILLFTACKSQTVTYKTDVSADSIIDACAAQLPSFSLLSEADEDYVTYRMMPDETTLAGHVVYIQNAGTSIDELGIFISATDDTAPVETMIEDYLARRNDEWTGMYLVEEYPKLRDAEYRVFGRYVVYAILSEDVKGQFFGDVDNYLRADN